jgi:nucleoside-diphosphate-sugar epimerase
MLYMPDAIRGTIELMDAPADKIRIRTSYNLAGSSFSPKELATKISEYLPEFKIDYEPDFRQEIAATWTESIDDSAARRDWGWEPSFDLESMTRDMIRHLRPKYDR